MRVKKVYAARIAGLKRRGLHDEAAVLQRELREMQLKEHIERVVAGAPPLTAEQRARLVMLLQPSTPAVA